MIGKRFVITFADGRRLDCDTALVLEHSLDAKPTSNPVEADSGGVAHSQDHVVIEPRTTDVEAIVSDTPLDPSLQPQAPGRVEAAVALLEQGVQAGMPVQVQAGLRTYARATLGGLRYDESLLNSGQFRFKLVVHEVLIATSRTAVVKRRVKNKGKGMAKAHKGVKFADKIKAVATGTATTI